MFNLQSLSAVVSFTNSVVRWSNWTMGCHPCKPKEVEGLATRWYMVGSCGWL